MAYCYCNIHNVSWDDSKRPQCLECAELLSELEHAELSDDANLEMGLPEGVDWGNK